MMAALAASAPAVLAASGASSPDPKIIAFSNKTAFLATISPGYYAENFDSLGPFNALGPLVSFSGSGFSYDASAPFGLFGIVIEGGDNALSTNTPFDSVRLTFTSGNARAVGGDFFHSGFFGGLVPGEVIVTLNDGTTEVVPRDFAKSIFRGFIARPGLSITSLEVIGLVSNGVEFVFPTVNNLIVGEPRPRF
jgi:hypothetical protein